MKRGFLVCVLCASIAHADVGSTRFVVTVFSYNNERWCVGNLDSVFGQQYRNFRVIYVDDRSTDKTKRYVRAYLRAHPAATCDYVRSPARRKKMANMYYVINEHCRDDEVVVELDGDDTLAHPHVLARLDEIYRSGDVWMTYGQYVTDMGRHGSTTGCKQIAPEIIAHNTFREHEWAGWPLRTFKAFLFKAIKKEDLMYEGQFFDVTADLAYMFPLFELAGTHARFVPEVLYIYNTHNPISDGFLYKQRQAAMDHAIRARARYLPLKR